MDVRISPSLLAADFTCLGEELRRVEAAGADMLHLDVMDGVFVPNISFGMPVIASLRRATGLFFDVHIMIADPLRYIGELARAGADGVTFHLEAAPDPGAVIRAIRERGLRPGITIRPGTPAEELLPWLPEVDLALVMTVEPGFGGQKFMEPMLEKVRAIRREVRRLGRPVTVQVDGGIGPGTAGAAAAAGADCLVAGSAVFGKADCRAAMEALRDAARAASPAE